MTVETIAMIPIAAFTGLETVGAGVSAYYAARLVRIATEALWSAGRAHEQQMKSRRDEARRASTVRLVLPGFSTKMLQARAKADEWFFENKDDDEAIPTMIHRLDHRLCPSKHRQH